LSYAEDYLTLSSGRLLIGAVRSRDIGRYRCSGYNDVIGARVWSPAAYQLHIVDGMTTSRLRDCTVALIVDPTDAVPNRGLRQWLQLYDWTAVRPRYDHSTTYVTTGLPHCGRNK